MLYKQRYLHKEASIGSWTLKQLGAFGTKSMAERVGTKSLWHTLGEAFTGKYLGAGVKDILSSPTSALMFGGFTLLPMLHNSNMSTAERIGSIGATLATWSIPLPFVPQMVAWSLADKVGTGIGRFADRALGNKPFRVKAFAPPPPPNVPGVPRLAGT